ncbi:hypothetical protein JCM39194_25740 [Desulfotomaculum varum]
MKLQKYREDQGLTQAKLAEKSGVSQAYICELEQGKKQPSVFIVKKLAKALGISVSKLLEDDEIPKASNE